MTAGRNTSDTSAIFLLRFDSRTPLHMSEPLLAFHTFYTTHMFCPQYPSKQIYSQSNIISRKQRDIKFLVGDRIKSKEKLFLTSCTTTCDKSKFYHISTWSPFFFFLLKLCSGSRVFWSHLRRKFSIVIEARPQLHNQWQIFVHARLLLVIQTYNNPLKLGPDTWGHVGEVKISAAWLLLW
jgi:hypothetical protein